MKVILSLTERGKAQVISKLGTGAVMQGSDVQQGADPIPPFRRDEEKNNCLGTK